MSNVDPIIVKLSVDDAQYLSRLKADSAVAERELGRIGAASDKMSNALKLGAAGLVAGVGAASVVLFNLAKQGLAYAASLGDTATQLGVTTKFLQEFRYAASQTGASVNDADGALGDFNKTIGKALEGSKPAIDAFKRLKIGTDDLVKASDSERFRMVADAIAAIPEPAQRSAVASDLFGDSAKKLLPLLEQGSDGFIKLAKEAREFGVVLSDKQIQDADKAGKKIDQLTTALNAKVAATVAENAEAIGTLANAFADLAANAADAVSAMIKWNNTENRRSYLLNKANIAVSDRGDLNWEQRQAILNEVGDAVERRLKREEAAARASAQKAGRAPLTPKPTGRGLAGSSDRAKKKEWITSEAEATKVAVGIARQMGIPVTDSGRRSYADQKRYFLAGYGSNPDKPGGAPHVNGTSIDLGTVSVALRKEFERRAIEAGINVDQKGSLTHQGTGKRKHGHVQWWLGDGPNSKANLSALGDQQLDAAKDAEKAERERLEAAKKSLREQYEHDSTIAAMNTELERNRGELAMTDDERLKSALKVQQMETDAQKAVIDHNIKLNKITGGLEGISEERGKELKALVEQRAEQEKQKLTQRANTELEQRLYEQRLNELEGDAETLESIQQNAVTRQQIHALDLAILAKQEEIEKAKLEEAIAAGQVKDAEKARAQQAERQKQRRIGVDRANESPMQRYIRTGQEQLANINDEFETIAINGIEAFNNGITDAIMNSKSLGDVFSNVAKQIIADLVRIAIKQLIVKALMSAISGGGGGDVSSFESLPTGIDVGGIFPRASGGHVNAGQLYRVHDKEYFRPAVSGEVLPMTRMARMAARPTQSVVQPIIQVDARGAVMNDQFARMILSQAKEHANSAAARAGQAAVKAAPGEVARRNRYG